MCSLVSILENKYIVANIPMCTALMAVLQKRIQVHGANL